MRRAELLFSAIAAAAVCASCASYNTFPQARVGKIDEPADLRNRIEDGETGPDGDYVIVDVRPVEKYAEGHIPTAINIPNGKVDEEGVEAPDTKKLIIVYCETGTRAQFAAKRMAEAGYAHVYNWGGFDGWPFDTESSPELLEKDDDEDDAEETEADEEEEEEEEAMIGDGEEIQETGDDDEEEEEDDDEGGSLDDIF